MVFVCVLVSDTQNRIQSNTKVTLEYAEYMYDIC